MSQRAAATALSVAIVCAAAPGPGAAASGSDACAVLRQVLDAAATGGGIAAITGDDAGLYHEAKVSLPGADFCASYPGEAPSGAWRCLLASEGKYSVALQELERRLRKTRDCLGDGWSATDTRSGAYLREVVLDRGGAGARVRMLVTRGVEPVKGWREHRIVLAVEFAPPPATTD